VIAMMKRITKLCDVCDICKEVEKWCVCDYCNKVLCQFCYKRINIRYDDQHKDQCVVCPECFDDVYSDYLYKLQQINETKELLDKQIKEANSLLNDIYKKRAMRKVE
jgi:hypothetical protein